MTYEIASQTFDKFKTVRHNTTAKVVAWVFRRFGYDTTIEHTLVPSPVRNKAFADYRTVFGTQIRNRWWYII